MPPFDLKRREPHVSSVQLSGVFVELALDEINNITHQPNHNGYLCCSGRGGVQ
jgi:hypothetical protein